MKQRMKQLLGILLTLAMVVGLMMGMSLTAYADEPYASLKNTTTVVKFDDKDWYLIDFDDSTVTLLSKECVGASRYNDSGWSVEYASSTVKGVVDNYYTNCISDSAKTAVSDGKMFLLTSDQADATSANVLKCSQASGAVGNYWWLCSPSFLFGNAACVYGDYGVLGSTYVRDALGVRPALKLNLSSVTFSSETNTFSFKVAVTGVSINKSSTTLTVGGTETLTATVGPENATDPSVTWSSSDTSVATVDANGKVTAVGAGTATITVTTTDGSKTATCAVTVNKKAGTISYAITALTKTNGDAAFTNALTQTGDGSVSYASDNTSVATVDSTGKVTIKGVGTATITATVSDSDTYTYTTKTVSYTLTVNANTYTVIFNANGLGTAPAAQTVAENATATKPTDPTAAGYTFGGWYEEAACTHAYDFTTAVTADITLYAKWTIVSSAEVVPKTPDTPVPTAEGMDDAASEAATDEEKDKVVSGKFSLDVKLQAEKISEEKAEGAQEIKNLVSSGSSVNMFFDLNLLIYVTNNTTGSTVSRDIGSVNKVVLRIKFPYDTARQNIQILRYHNGAAQAFTKLEAEPTGGYTDGTYFVGNGFVALYASGFSTYAIADSGYAQPGKQTEKQPETIAYSSIRISKVKHTKNKLKLTWDMVPGAEGYDIFASFCGSPERPEPVMTVSTTSAIIKKVYSKTGLKKVDRGCIKYLIKAYKTVNGQKNYIAESYLNHSAGTGHRKYSDAKKITTKKSTYTLTVGQNAKLKAKVKTRDGKKQVDHVKAFRYLSSNPGVATVSGKGKITAVKAGTCQIYVIAANGLTKVVTVTVQ